MCYFIDKFLGIKLSADEIRVCHFLGRTTGSPIIVKFLYFHQKNSVYNRRTIVVQRENENSFNQQPISKRPPKEQRELQKQAEANGWITTTNNCKVKLFLEGTNSSRHSQNVASETDIDNLISQAVRRMLKISSNSETMGDNKDPRESDETPTTQYCYPTKKPKIGHGFICDGYNK